MDKRIKKLWVEALRSGEFEQGRNQLCIQGEKHDRFCCLGVLCELHARETDQYWEGVQYIGTTTTLPNIVVKWAELNDDNPDIKKIPLGSHNDGNELDNVRKPKSFKQIANLIEKWL